MEEPEESTRSSAVVAVPTPATVAVITLPPAEPLLGEMLTRPGVRARVVFATIEWWPSGKPTSKKMAMPDSVDELTLLMAKTASVLLTELVVWATPLTVNSTELVVPVNPVPVALTVHTFELLEYSAATAVTVGMELVYVHVQALSGTQTASSDVFKKVITFPEVPAVLAIFVATRHLISVALVLYTKQSTLPTAPSVLSCTGLSVISVPKLVPVMVRSVPP